METLMELQYEDQKITEPMRNGVYAGRYTAQMDEPFIVFLIGMRVNSFWQFNKWFPTAMAMPPMLQELFTHAEEKGFLGGEMFYRFGPLTTMMVTYWRSFEDLERFARSKDDPHLPAWKEFYKRVGNDGSVGIYHETYVIPAGHHESIYGNMPRFGLAAATQHVPVTGRLHAARTRLPAAEVEAALELAYTEPEREIVGV
jgi:hypothetical protein